MSDTGCAAGEISVELAGIVFPEGFLDEYDLLECMSVGHGAETYLARQKNSGARCVVKCYDKLVCGEVVEGDILKTLCHEGLPVFMGEYGDNAHICVVREYVEGIPLNKYLSEHELAKERAVSICAELCDILTYLHTREPPVIHRDIKPSNIIIGQSGGVSLIDFDIARTSNAEAEADTRLMGTRAYASPEQYGFSQTDCRTDIYSLGVLLCYLLTGSVDVRNTDIADKRIAAVVRRCAAFSPDDRYADARAVKKALLNSDGHRGRQLKRFARITALALACLCAGFVIGRYGSFPAFTDADASVRFAEPLIERAARAQLGIDDDEGITLDQLYAVRELYIFGNKTSKTEEPFSEGLGGSLGDEPRGTLATLTDVRLMPNLETLYINYQTLTDISPVSSLKNLVYLSLRNTFVEDISALRGMKRLSRVSLFDTRVSDMSPLGSCLSLISLDAGKTSITSLDALPELPALRELSLRHTALASPEGIERFKNLERLDLCRTMITDISPLAALPRLKSITVDDAVRDIVETLEDTSITVEYE